MGFPFPGSVSDSSAACGLALLQRGQRCRLSVPVPRVSRGLGRLVSACCSCRTGERMGVRGGGSRLEVRAGGGGWSGVRGSRFTCLLSDGQPAAGSSSLAAPALGPGGFRPKRPRLGELPGKLVAVRAGETLHMSVTSPVRTGGGLSLAGRWSPGASRPPPPLSSGQLCGDRAALSPPLPAQQRAALA